MQFFENVSNILTKYWSYLLKGLGMTMLIALIGTVIGLLIGLFFGILGIIFGPFLGAFVGELIVDTPPKKAIKVACINFIAFIFSTGVKLVYSIALMVMIFIEVWRLIWL